MTIAAHKRRHLMHYPCNFSFLAFSCMTTPLHCTSTRATRESWKLGGKQFISTGNSTISKSRSLAVLANWCVCIVFRFCPPADRLIRRIWPISCSYERLCPIRFPHDSQGVRGTGSYPVRVPSANAKSAVPRFFSAEHRSIPCNNKTYSYPCILALSSCRACYPKRPRTGWGGQPWPLWQWPFGHSIIIVVLFLGYAAEDDDGWIHEVV